MARRTKEDAAQTRIKIMDAARKVFFDRGMAHSSLLEVASLAGVTRGAVYWHFRDKLDLLLALADETFSPQEELLHRLACEPLDKPLKVLKDACEGALASIITDPARRSVFTILTQRCEYYENKDLKALMQRNTDCRERVREYLTTIFTQAQERGLLSLNWTAKAAALALHGMFFGFIMMEMEHPAPNVQRSAHYRTAIESLFKAFAWDGIAFKEHGKMSA